MTIRYRKMDANGDYVFGEPPYVEEFYIDQKEAIQQAILTRLQLWVGEWFLNLDEGTDYNGKVLGYVPPNVRDFTIRQRILDTLGVTALSSFESSVDSDRRYTVTASVDTIYGQTTVSVTI